MEKPLSIDRVRDEFEIFWSELSFFLSADGRRGG